MIPEQLLLHKHLVITGFTGFVAKVYAALLLTEVNDVHLTLLVRGRGRQSAVDRVQRIFEQNPVFRDLRAHHQEGYSDWLSQRITVLSADLDKANAGLKAPEMAALQSADLLVHSAGLTDFNPDPLKAIRTNIEGALNAAELALKLSIPLVHVSTCYVAGNQSGLIGEELTVGLAPSGLRFNAKLELKAVKLACRPGGPAKGTQARVDVANQRAARLGWPNIYTYTKGLAEHLLASVEGLQLAIARPAIVECAREFPFAGWNEGLNTTGPLAWLITTAFRRLPSAGHHHFDVIAVDDVARGLGAISARTLMADAQNLEVYQLASSDVAPLHFARTVELTGLAHRRWVRKNPEESSYTAHLDPISVGESGGFFGVSRLKKLTSTVRERLDNFNREELPRWADSLIGEPWQAFIDDQLVTLKDADYNLDRVEKMLELYKPFIFENDYVFSTSNSRALCSSGPFCFDVSDLDWCDYWVNVQYPGLRKWCIPVIEGRIAPVDPVTVKVDLSGAPMMATGK